MSLELNEIPFVEELDYYNDKIEQIKNAQVDSFYNMVRYTKYCEMNRTTERYREVKFTSESYEFSSYWVDGVNCEQLKHKDAEPSKLCVLLIKGGAFVMNMSDIALRFLCKCMSACDASIGIAPNFGTNIDTTVDGMWKNVVKVMEVISKEYDIMVFSDSAGASTATLAISHLSPDALSKVKGTVYLCPWVDVGCSSPSYIENTSDCYMSEANVVEHTVRVFNEISTSMKECCVDLVHPIYKNFPPTLIQASGLDPCLDDAYRLALVLHASGASVRLDIFQQMYHCFQMWDHMPNTVKIAWDNIHEFSKECCAGGK